MTGQPAVLVIAGSDSSGGAGMQRDLRALADCDVEAVSAITAITAQTNNAVLAVHHVPLDIIRAQIKAALDCRDIRAIKIGMLGTRETVEAVASCVRGATTLPVVLDPVLASSSGTELLDAPGRAAMYELLFPMVTLLTPNIPESALITSMDVARTEEAMVDQARAILTRGPKAVLIKGGHGRGTESVEWLVTDSENPIRLAAPRLNVAMRGTGCALASAIAAQLAKGASPAEACQYAKRYLTGLLRTQAGQCSAG